MPLCCSGFWGSAVPPKAPKAAVAALQSQPRIRGQMSRMGVGAGDGGRVVAMHGSGAAWGSRGVLRVIWGTWGGLWWCRVQEVLGSGSWVCPGPWHRGKPGSPLCNV